MCSFPSSSRPLSPHSLSCYQVGSQWLLLEELSEECWTRRHLRWALSIGLAGLVFWVLGLPLGVWLVLRENRELLGNLKLKSRLGFLYSGFRERRYYWEMVGVLRKAAIAAVSVFLIQAGTLVQSFLLLVLLVVSLLLSLRMQPYERPLLNHLELASLGALLISVFAGLFFLASRHSASAFFQQGKDCKCSVHSLSLSLLS